MLRDPASVPVYLSSAETLTNCFANSAVTGNIRSRTPAKLRMLYVGAFLYVQWYNSFC